MTRFSFYFLFSFFFYQKEKFINTKLEIHEKDEKYFPRIQTIIEIADYECIMYIIHTYTIEKRSCIDRDSFS